MMANLCVLTYYKEGVCDLMISELNDESTYANNFYDNDGYKANFPWLFYRSANDFSPMATILEPATSNLEFRATLGVADKA